MPGTHIDLFLGLEAWLLPGSRSRLPNLCDGLPDVSQVGEVPYLSVVMGGLLAYYCTYCTENENPTTLAHVAQAMTHIIISWIM